MMIQVGQQAYMLFDGDCGICSWSAEYVRSLDHRRFFAIEPYQSFAETELAEFGISYDQCAQKMHVITSSGKVYRGAFAVNYFFWQYWPWKLLVALIYLIPLILVAEIFVYAWVARHRHQISQWFGMKACLLRSRN